MVDARGSHTTDEAADRIARELDRRGLGAAARLLADAHRPLAPLASDIGVALGGLLGALGGRTAITLRALVEDETALERLVARLDEAGERRAESR
jgi:hypothetical protein